MLDENKLDIIREQTADIQREELLLHTLVGGGYQRDSRYSQWVIMKYNQEREIVSLRILSQN